MVHVQESVDSGMWMRSTGMVVSLILRSLILNIDFMHIRGATTCLHTWTQPNARRNGLFIRQCRCQANKVCAFGNFVITSFPPQMRAFIRLKSTQFISTVRIDRVGMPKNGRVAIKSIVIADSGVKFNHLLFYTVDLWPNLRQFPLKFARKCLNASLQ